MPHSARFPDAPCPVGDAPRSTVCVRLRAVTAGLTLALAACSMPSGSDVVITTAAELAVRRAAVRERPVRLRSVVTYSDPKWQHLFVQDSTGAVTVWPDERQFAPGTVIDVMGVAMEGPETVLPPVVTASRIEVGETTTLPVPRQRTLPQLAGGQCNGR